MQEPLTRQQWLQARTKGLGGSDAEVVMGLAQKKPFALWAEKTGKLDPVSLDDLEYIQWGQILEDPIAQETARRLELQLADHGRTAIAFSPQYPFMHCTIDREIKPKDALGQGALSIKCAGLYMKNDWDEEPPLWAQVQVQHELVVHGWQWGLIAVLIGGNHLEVFPVRRNENFCNMLLEKEAEFWRCVTQDVPPPVDESDSTAEVLKRLYPKDDGSQVVLPVDAYVWADELETAKEKRKLAEQTIQQYQNLVEAHIGDATYGIFPTVDGVALATLPERTLDAIVAQEGRLGFTWKRQERAAYNVEKGAYRVLRVEKAGKAKKGRK